RSKASTRSTHGRKSDAFPGASACHPERSEGSATRRRTDAGSRIPRCARDDTPTRQGERLPEVRFDVHMGEVIAVPAPASRPSGAPPAIAFSGVTCAYDLEPVLEDVTLSFGSGELVGCVGTSGD